MVQALSDDLRRRAVTAAMEEGMSRRGGARGHPQRRRRAPLPAALLARPQPDRDGVLIVQDPPQTPRRPHPRRTRRRHIIGSMPVPAVIFHSGEWKPLPSGCTGTLASPPEFSAVPVRFPGFPDRDRTSQRVRRGSQTGRYSRCSADSRSSSANISSSSRVQCLVSSIILSVSWAIPCCAIRRAVS